MATPTPTPAPIPDPIYTAFVTQATTAGANTSVADMLWLARTGAVAGGVPIASADHFFDLLFTTPSVIQLFNQTQVNGALRNATYGNAPGAGRSAYASGARGPGSVTFVRAGETWSIASLRAVYDNSGPTPRVPNGTIYLGTALFQDGNAEDLSDQGVLYVVAHELGHALNAFTFDQAISDSINEGFTYLIGQQATIDVLPVEERANQRIDVTAQLRAVLDTAAREEGHGNLIAYNIWADQFRASHGGALPTDADRQALYRVETYFKYVFGADGKFPTDATGAPLLSFDANGKLIDNAQNLAVLGDRNNSEQLGDPASHQLVYVGDALGFFIAHASSAPLQFNANELGFITPGVSFKDLLKHWVIGKVAGTAVVWDTSQTPPVSYTVTTIQSGTSLHTSVFLPPDPNTPNVAQNLVINLGVQDGSGAIFERSSIEIRLHYDGSLKILLSDQMGGALEISEKDFEHQFGMSPRSLLDDGGEASQSVLRPFTLAHNDVTGEINVTFANPAKYIPEGVRLNNTKDGFLVPVDYRGREVTYIYRDGVLVDYSVSEDGATVISQLDSNKRVIATEIKINSNPIPIDFSDIGGSLGYVLGYRLAGDNKLAGVVSSAFLKTLGNNLGDALDGIIGGLDGPVQDAFKSFDDELLRNLKSAGIGAISSFLTAELVNVIRLDGFAGELANTAAGAAIGQIASNLASLAAGGRFAADGVSQLKVFSDVNPGMIGVAVGSFLGTKLASTIISFDTVGGQIGSAVGSSLGVAVSLSFVAGTGASATWAGLQLGALAGPVGAFVGAFVGFILGGLIGSVFGGTPSAWAESQWDESEGKFVVANVRSKHGGSKKAARSLASAASETFNGILSATGGELLDPTAVQSGTYGMRGKKFVYKPLRAGDITQKFSGKDAATKVIGYGVYTGLTDPDFKIAGGDVYVKRALYNTFEMGGLDPRNFDSSVLLGNIASAQAYESYLANSTVINALVAAQPDSVFAAETMINLARALELGLTRRHASDWYGGFDYLIREAGTNAANVEFGFDYDPYSDKISRLIGVGDYVLGDAIDIGGQTMIEAGAANDVIDLRGKTLADQRGYTVNGDLQDDIAVSGTDFTALTTSVTFATANDDEAPVWRAA